MLVVHDEGAFAEVLEEPLCVALAPPRWAVRATPSREVGLCKYRQFDVGQHDAAIDRGHDHATGTRPVSGGEGDAVIGQQ